MDFTGPKTVAVVGVSDNPERDSYKVSAYLREQGYRVIPINPAIKEVLGEKGYPSLTSIPPEVKVDIVDIFRRSDAVEPIVEEAIKRGAATVWMQLGVVNGVAAERARQAGLEVVMDRCLMIEHRRWKEGGKVD